MIKRNKEDYSLPLSVIIGKHRVEGVLCEVHLPKRVVDPVQLLFHPTEAQLAYLDCTFEFSVYGEIKDFSGTLRTIIKADKVYNIRSSTRYWGPQLSEISLIGEPTDLRIIDLLNEDGQADKSEKTLEGTFWLTPNAMLSPMYSRTHFLTGATTVERIKPFEFTLFNGLHLTVTHHYRYLDNENGETVSFPELVAEFKIGTKKGEVNSLLEGVDDFLMLTSFAARQSCVCLGWDSYDSSTVVQFFRRDIAIPEMKKRHGVHDGLIEVKDFADFISAAYAVFVVIERKDLIRQAVHRAIRRGDGTIESNYLILYSAFETLILFSCRNFENEFILSRPDWKEFRKDIEDFITSHPQFSEDKERRKLVYEKLLELNRVSFSSAFDRFCQHFNVDLSDLWPVVDLKDGISLADIRNKLIHGDILNPLEGRALISAKENLRWVVERSLLSVLGWHVANSKVSKEYVSKMKMYKKWREARKILTQLK